jgi:hypothetical protein
VEQEGDAVEDERGNSVRLFCRYPVVSDD